jgi:hypothetical protein
MKIQIPDRFAHAGELRQLGPIDPRKSPFKEGSLDFDARECNFILPAAVLWCAVYPLLARARGVACRFLVPENLGVCIYLKSVGLFELLKKGGVEVDDRDVPDLGAQKLILPLTRFDTESDVDRITNLAHDRLQETAVGAANLYPIVSEVFAELAMNAAQHSGSEIGAFGLIQFYEFSDGQKFVCAVADGGIGIRRSLERNPELTDRVSYDWNAIELALDEGITGTGSKRRGIGLFGVAEDMSKPGRQLMIHSGIGMLQAAGGSPRGAPNRTVLFPGTLASASIPT